MFLRGDIKSHFSRVLQTVKYVKITLLSQFILSGLADFEQNNQRSTQQIYYPDWHVNYTSEAIADGFKY